MRMLATVFSLCLLTATAFAQAPAPSVVGRTTSPAAIHTAMADAKRAVVSNGPGQGGYVHYFLITHPDGSLEDQVGIETNDQRIAWSFPTAGVIVSEFVKQGEIVVNGNTFRIEHLHGVRPFTSNAEMQTLQQQLVRRIAFWIDDETPYCIMRQPGERYCLNCGDFVAQILFPGATPLIPAMPADYPRADRRILSSTDDLLLYLLGFHRITDAKTKLRRLATMDIPKSLREDLSDMLAASDRSRLAQSPAAPPATGIAKPVPAPPIGRLAGRRQQAQKL